MPLANKKPYLVVILTLFLTGLVTLLYRPLSLDELNMANLMELDQLGKVLNWIRDHDTQLPLFYIFSYILYPLAKLDPFLLRLPSVIFTLLAIYLSYQHIKKVENESSALKFVILSLSSLFLFQEAYSYRPYGLLFLLSCLAYIKRKSSGGYLYLVILAFMSFTHYFGLALALCLLVLDLINDKTKRKAALYFLPIIIFLTYFFGKDIFTDLLVIHAYRNFSLTQILEQFIYFNSGVLTTMATFILYLLYVPKRIKILKELLPVTLIFVFCLIKATFSTPIVEARYFIIGLYPYLFILSKYSKAKIFILVTLTSTINAILLYPTDPFHSKKVTEQIKSLTSTHKALVTSCDMTLKYYYPDFHDCYYNKQLNSSAVIYIKNTTSTTDCHCYRNLRENYTQMSSTHITNSEILLFEKK